MDLERISIVTMNAKSSASHSGTVDILTMLYFKIMNIDPSNPTLKSRDKFILSKGHGSSALAERGYFSKNLLDGGQLPGHLDAVPGVEVSSGSLGHGLSIGVGMAIANKIDQLDNHVYVMCGDGELNEGSVWEALLVAYNLDLPNLTVIYDDNRSHSRGLQISNPAEKFSAFGCEVAEVHGHDIEALKAALQHRAERTQIIIARTCKGYGCQTFIDSHYEWHRRSPSDVEYQKLLEELDA